MPAICITMVVLEYTTIMQVSAIQSLEPDLLLAMDDIEKANSVLGESADLYQPILVPISHLRLHFKSQV